MGNINYLTVIVQFNINTASYLIKTTINALNITNYYLLYIFYEAIIHLFTKNKYFNNYYSPK